MTTKHESEQDVNRETGVSTEMLNDDYIHIDVMLDEDDIESLNNGSGITWELETGDDEMLGVYVGAQDDTGLGEYAFKSYVEEQYGEGTYRFDFAVRVLQTRSFWARVAAYSAAFVSAPFVIMALNGSAAVAFVYAVVLMFLLPVLLDTSPIRDPMEVAKHD